MQLSPRCAAWWDALGKGQGSRGTPGASHSILLDIPQNLQASGEHPWGLFATGAAVSPPAGRSLSVPSSLAKTLVKPVLELGK